MSLINKVSELTAHINILKQELSNAKQETEELKEIKGSTDNPELLEELEMLRRIKSDRETILQDLDSRYFIFVLCSFLGQKPWEKSRPSLRWSKTKLKFWRIRTKCCRRSLRLKNRKIDSLISEINDWTSRAEKAEKEKESLEIEYKGKVDMLEHKLLNKLENDNNKQDNVAFEELLDLWKSNLESIMTAIQSKGKNDDEVEEELRKEILESAKK